MTSRKTAARMAMALALGAIVVLPLGRAEPALAQMDYLLQGLPHLTERDRALARETSQERLADAPEGTTLSWYNPESGNSGTVTLVRRFERQGRECHENRHDISFTDGAARRQQQWTITICRQENGRWAME